MAKKAEAPIYRADTVASPLKNDKYVVKHLKYPDNVGGQDTEHYVCFYINVRGQSKFNKTGRIGIRSNESNGISEEKMESNLGWVGAGATVAGLVGWAGATYANITIGKRLAAATHFVGPVAPASTGSQVVGGMLGGDASKSALANTAGGAGKLLAGAGAAALVIDALFDADQKMRLNEVITLAIQQSPSTKYSVMYDDTSLGSIAGMMGATGTTTGFASIGSAGSAAGDMVKIAAMSAARLPGQIAQSFDLAASAEFMSKQVPNPFKELLFKTVDRRSFNFEYRFMPKNEAESKNIHNIIERFRFHMHPELNSTKMFYIYPSEFEIVYYYKTTENMWFSKISTCALSNMSVEYGGEQFVTYSNGAPTEVILRLTFEETEILTKDRLSVKGYDVSEKESLSTREGF